MPSFLVPVWHTVLLVWVTMILGRLFLRKRAIFVDRRTRNMLSLTASGRLIVC